MDKIIRGRVWKFGDNIDTDGLAPAEALHLPWGERKQKILPTRPGFVDDVQPGDIIVAGRNWGCGSSREQAAENMKNLGLAAIAAESFGRIFFRNAVAIALPAAACPGIASSFEEGERMELDLQAAKVRNLTRNIELDCVPYTRDMLEILAKGGMLNLLGEHLVRANA